MMLVMACNNHLSRSGSFPIEESSDNESIICNRAVLSEYFSSRNFWAMTKSSFPEVIPRIIKSADAFRAIVRKLQEQFDASEELIRHDVTDTLAKLRSVGAIDE